MLDLIWWDGDTTRHQYSHLAAEVTGDWEVSLWWPPATSHHTAAGMKIVLNHNIQLDSIERVNCQGHEKSRIRYWGLNNIFTHMWIVEKTETEYGSVNFNRNIYCIVIIPTRFLPIITSDRLGREWDLTYLLGPWAGSLQWNCRVLYFII